MRVRSVKHGLVAFLWWAVCSSCVFAGPRDAAWKQVDEAIKKGLPKTAIEILDPIIEAASNEKAYPEAIKAIGKKISLQGQIQGAKPEEKIIRLQAELAKAPAEMHPMMEAILANWYWEYFQRNRWRFARRTTTQQAPGDDFQTWDLPRLFAEVDRHLQNSLVAKEQLQKTPVQDYDELFRAGDLPDTYRPTLYDFVVHSAIQVYTAAEQAALRPEEVFEVDAEGAIFADAATFLNWQPNTTDTESPKLCVIQLYQDLLRFHQSDTDRTAWLDVELARYQYAKNVVFGETKNSRFVAAMKRIVDQHSSHELSSKAFYYWAQTLNADDNAMEAHQVATLGKNAHPESVGGRLCHNLIQQIEAKSASIATERVWHDPLPEIRVTYRNVDKVHFRVIKLDFLQRLIRQTGNPEYLEYANNNRDRNVGLAVQDLVSQPTVRSWTHDLPETDDFRQRVEDIAAPEDLSPGFYALLASHDPEFSGKENQLSYAPFWVSKMAIITRTDYRKGGLNGFVLDSKSGDPIDGATVQLYRYDRQTGSWAPSVKATTNANGQYSYRNVDKKGERNSYLILASHDGHQVATRSGQRFHKNAYKDAQFESTVLFTDRALYRPGQTIQFKGICYRSDHKNDDYKTIAPGRTLTVVLRDANNKIVETLQMTTNDYGSFHGSFTAPRGRLTGRMTINVTDGPGGAAVVQVEEYKRPKFEVKIDAPEDPAKLNKLVTVTGRATAYTGAAVDGAKVKYRVVRETRYPIWWHWRCWWIPPRPQSSQPIAHGTAMTNADGSFQVEFKAIPDPATNESDEPTFQYTVYTDVTDTAGETRSATRRISVGFTALKATMTTGDWLTVDEPVELKIDTATLNGEPLAASGTLQIFHVKQPETIARPRLSGGYYPAWRYRGSGVAPEPDPANSNSWPLGDVAVEHDFKTDASGKTTFATKLPVGIYRAKLQTTDRFGKPVTAVLPFHVLAPNEPKLDLKLADLFEAPQWKAEAGEEFQALWGSGYDHARAFVEIEHRQKILAAYWTNPSETQTLIKQKVNERMRGGFTVRVTRVKENRAFLHARKIDVPWSNKDLTLSWERIVSKLEPGQKETWTAVVKGKDAKAAVAEMVATLYDESLDAYRPHRWKQTLRDAFRQDHSTMRSTFENEARSLQAFSSDWSTTNLSVSQRYRSWLPEFAPAAQHFGGYGGGGIGAGYARGATRLYSAAPMAMSAARNNMLAKDFGVASDSLRMEKAAMPAAAEGGYGGAAEPPVAESETPDLSNVSARTNLQETAFFLPHLVSAKDGEVRLQFSMPEALTRWKFFGFAHDKAMRSGFITDSVVTSKDLMIQPNPPRFLREGDTLAFTVRVTNQSAARQTGVVRLTFADARTGESVDSLLSLSSTDQRFNVPAQESRTYKWTLNVPDGLNVLTYKAVASSGRLSDGEEGYLPVLSRRVLVIESLPLPIRRPITKDFEFTKLLESVNSDSLKHQSLTVQMTSNPSWYAVMALPYLMEYPHECSEQTFNRLYANALAQYIANSDPKIRRIFDQWKGTKVVDSPLEKNEDLKSLLLEETPWVRQGESESQARRNVGILFDANRLVQEQTQTTQKLIEAQNADGLWPWFPGGRGNEYISLYITTGYGRLRHLGVPIDVAPAVRSLSALDAWMDRTYDAIKSKERNHLSHTTALYLYARSFFQKEQPVAPEYQEAFRYFVGQAKQHWLTLGDRQSQAHIAIALHRLGDRPAAQGIMHSLKERSVTDDELGMFWRDTEMSWWWFRAPIESQAMMIEAFDEVTGDAESVELCRVWLLKQKQTQAWKTTKATADAVYGLLLRGTDILSSSKLVSVSLGGNNVDPGRDVEAGTGFYEKRFVGPEVLPAMGKVQVTKEDTGVAWGSVHWQYLEDVSKVTPHDGTPLKLEKQLFVKENTARGPVLKPIDGALHVGDELVVRIVLRTDRDMEFVHLKDQRASGTEPVNVISRYKQQDGLAYYESTRDTATHHYIDYLPKGNYVFEYSVRVQHAGEYQSGLAEIQCMYAPEFNSHSESQLLRVE